MGCIDDETTGQKRIVRHKNSLSMSPIRNTLAKNKEKYVSSWTTGFTKYADSRYDSTQESLNIEAYMQNNSTIAIEEVDEDEYKEQAFPFVKIKKPTRLPSLNYNPLLPDVKKSKSKLNKAKSSLKHENWIFMQGM